jgi:hypothetical protein
MPRSPQLVQISEEQWHSRMDSLNSYAVEHGYAVPSLPTWFPESSIIALAHASLPRSQRTYYPGSIRLAVAVEEAGQQSELFALLAQTANSGTCNTGIQYAKRTSAGYTKITRTDLRPDAWTFEKWADLVAARDRGMGQCSMRWHYKIKIMCTIALLLSRYYDGPVVVDGNSVSLHQQSQVSLSRTMHNHIGQ